MQRDNKDLSQPFKESDCEKVDLQQDMCARRDADTFKKVVLIDRLLTERRYRCAVKISKEGLSGEKSRLLFHTCHML